MSNRTVSVLTAVGFALTPLALVSPPQAAATPRTVVVEVSAPGGGPAAGARVSLLAPGPPKAVLLAEGRTDAKGRACLTCACPDEVQLAVSTANLLFDLRTVNTASTDPIKVALLPGGGATVRMIDKATGQPVRRFALMALPVAAAALNDLALTTTLFGRVDVESDQGLATLKDLPAEGLVFGVGASGHRPHLGVVKPGDELTAELDTTGCRQRLVIDAASGKPLSGVQAVWAGGVNEAEELAALPTRMMAAESDKSGALTLCPGGEEGGRLALMHPGYAPSFVFIPADPAAAGPPERILLHRGAVLEVAAATFEGRPQAGVGVRFRSPTRELSAVTDAAGVARFRQLTPEPEITVEVTPPGATMPSEARAVGLRDGETVREQFYLQPQTRIRLLIDGAPAVDRALVAVGPPPPEQKPRETLAEAQTDAEGVAAFNLPKDPGPEGALVLRDPLFLNYLPWPVAAKGAPPGAIREVALEARWIEGRVLAKDDLAPLAGALLSCKQSCSRVTPATGLSWVFPQAPRAPLRLEAVSKEIFGSPPMVFGATDRQGKFRLPIPPDCDGSLHVEGPADEDDSNDWEPTSLEDEDLEQQPLTILLRRAAFLEALLVDENGAAVAEPHYVELQEPKVRSTPGGRFGSGRIALPSSNLSGNLWLLVTRPPGFAPAVSGPHGPDDPGPHLLTLTRGGHIAVQLPASADQPPTGALSVIGGDGLDWALFCEQRALPDGVIELGPLPPGEYRVIAGDQQGVGRIRQAGDRVVVRLDRR